jgi:hypothetical protein
MHPMTNLRKRYIADACFHQLVDCFRYYLRKKEASAVELSAAIDLAVDLEAATELHLAQQRAVSGLHGLRYATEKPEEVVPDHVQ